MTAETLRAYSELMAEALSHVFETNWAIERGDRECFWIALHAIEGARVRIERTQHLVPEIESAFAAVSCAELPNASIHTEIHWVASGTADVAYAVSRVVFPDWHVEHGNRMPFLSNLAGVPLLEHYDSGLAAYRQTFPTDERVNVLQALRLRELGRALALINAPKRCRLRIHRATDRNVCFLDQSPYPIQNDGLVDFLEDLISQGEAGEGVSITKYCNSRELKTLAPEIRQLIATTSGRPTRFKPDVWI